MSPGFLSFVFGSPSLGPVSPSLREFNIAAGLCSYIVECRRNSTARVSRRDVRLSVSAAAPHCPNRPTLIKQWSDPKREFLSVSMVGREYCVEKKSQLEGHFIFARSHWKPFVVFVDFWELSEGFYVGGTCRFLKKKKWIQLNGFDGKKYYWSSSELYLLYEYWTFGFWNTFF